MAILDKAKQNIEKKIERMNQRIAKVKEIEAKLRQQWLTEVRNSLSIIPVIISQFPS